VTSIEAIFAKLAVTYGSRLQTSLGGMDAYTVRKHWAHELRNMPDWAIAYALGNLPDRFPPNVLEFKALCQAATAPQQARLTAPKGKGPSPEVLARLGALKAALTHAPADPLGWAKQLKRRHEAGDKLTLFQIEKYRQALRLGVPQ